MYDKFRWTNASARRNRLTMEYEPLQPFFLLALAEAAGCETFIDVGANVGVYSLFATLIPRIRRIVAFEANPQALSELRANIELNDAAGVIEIEGRAVSDAAGRLDFGIVSKLSGANSVVSTSLHDESSFHGRITVQAVALDSILSSLSDGALCMKIDVEGHELSVIAGAARTLSEEKTVLQIEAYAGEGRLIAERLRELGYSRLTTIGPDTYFTNIEVLLASPMVVEVYERATQQLIEYNHRNKVVILKRGDVALQLTGKTGDLARAMAKRLIGKHL